MKDVYSFKSYKECIDHFLNARKQVWGAKSQMAQFLGCQPGFISQVLGGDLHFSQEQLLGVCEFLQFDEVEQDFLILLLNRERSGSSQLKSYFEEKIRALLRERESIKNRINTRSETKPELASEYYSSWKYNVVHMLLRIDQYKDTTQLKEMLNLSSAEIEQMIGLLRKMGLVEGNGKRLAVTDERVHIASDSPWITRHHMNWRLQAIQQIQDRPKKGLHFSSVMSISAEAHAQIKSLILDAIERSEPVIREAKDEQVSVLLLDLFRFEGS